MRFRDVFDNNALETPDYPLLGLIKLQGWISDNL